MSGVEARLARVTALPLHRYLGVESLQAADGRASLTLTNGEATQNPNGVLHGGVLYTVCDVCAYAALLSLLPESDEAVTHDLHVSVLRSAAAGALLNVSATVVKRGRAVCFIDAEVRVGDQLIATARITKSILRLSV